MPLTTPPGSHSLYGEHPQLLLDGRHTGSRSIQEHAVFGTLHRHCRCSNPESCGRACVQLIFAHPQAKGRVERAAGTFQDRLVTELRLAGATTIDDANRVLEGFLPHFNGRFKVPARESEAAYRAVDEGVRLDRVLCFKYRRRVARDNTVRYRWRTLQLLPCTDRPSYAGAAVNVLEGLDGRLAVQHEERIVPSQEAPPRPSVLRGFAKRTTHSPIINQPTNGLGRKWAAKLATLDTNHDAEHPIATSAATVLEEFVKLRRCDAGNPPRYRRPGGKRCRRRSARDCPCVGSPGSWVYTEIP